MDLSIIIPAYNEEPCIEKCVREIIRYLSETSVKYEIIIVNDGSTDKTRKICNTLIKKHGILLFNHEINKGYSGAIKTGINNSTGEYISYIDADLQYSPQDLIKMYHYTIKHANPLVIGKPESKSYNLFRNSLSLGYNFLIYILFGVKLKNINSLKIIKKNILSNIKIGHSFGIIDAEIIVRLMQKGYNFHQYPIKVYKRTAGKSKFNIYLIYKTIIELARLRLNF